MIAWLNDNPGIMLLLLMVGFAAVGWVKLANVRRDWQEFQAWRATKDQGGTQSLQPIESAQPVIDLTTVKSAASALANPPKDLRAIITELRRRSPGEKYQIPFGWVAAKGEAWLVHAGLVGGINHMLISGQSDAGKDNLALTILFTLAAEQSPKKVQFCIIDGKGLDFVGWEQKQHTWKLALEPQSIAPTMKALTTERERRGRILRTAQVAKWDEYTGDDLPLLVVYVSELSLLEDAVGKSDLTGWLNSELAAGRAFGIRYIIATQTASNFATRWRSQISLYLAAFQPSQSQDEPNTGLTSKELREAGLVPPSELPSPPSGAGVFTLVKGRSGYTLRTSYFTSEHRRWLLSQLPNAQKPLQAVNPEPTQQAPKKLPEPEAEMLLTLLRSGQPLPIREAVPEAVGSSAEARSNHIFSNPGSVEAPGSAEALLSVSDTLEALPLPPEEIPAEEQQAILKAATRLPSRSQVCQEIYSTRGGRAWEKVKMVCDAAGVL
jgi:hypothetical protein